MAGQAASYLGALLEPESHTQPQTQLPVLARQSLTGTRCCWRRCRGSFAMLRPLGVTGWGAVADGPGGGGDDGDGVRVGVS